MASSDEGVAESAGQSVHPGEILRALHQSLIFGSGSRMSRELFRELLSAEGPSAVSAFQAFMHTSVALAERGARVVSTMSRLRRGGDTPRGRKTGRAAAPGRAPASAARDRRARASVTRR